MDLRLVIGRCRLLPVMSHDSWLLRHVTIDESDEISIFCCPPTERSKPNQLPIANSHATSHGPGQQALFSILFVSRSVICLCLLSYIVSHLVDYTVYVDYGGCGSRDFELDTNVHTRLHERRSCLIEIVGSR